jgi:hypothetical protein
MQVRKEDRIYAAGLVDGEGCVGINRHHNKNTCGTYYTAFVRIEMTYPQILKWMQHTFGGSFLPLKKRGNCKQTYVWGLYADNALKFLEKIYPYTKLKVRHIHVIRQLQSLQLPKNIQPATKPNLKAKESCYKRVRKLNGGKTT